MHELLCSLRSGECYVHLGQEIGVAWQDAVLAWLQGWLRG